MGFHHCALFCVWACTKPLLKRFTMHPLFDKELQQKIIDLFKNNPYHITRVGEHDDIKINLEHLRSEYENIKFKTNLQYLIEENILLEIRANYRLTHEYIKNNLFIETSRA